MKGNKTAAAAGGCGRERLMAASVAVRQLVAAVALLACACLLQSPAAVSATKFNVGNEKGWNPGVNYTIWAKDKHFYVGDWLVFYYQTGQADVLQVNETAYNQCLADGPIVNYSKGRSFAFELNRTGHYYFICSRGYCYGGMRLAIKVEKIPPPLAPLRQASGAAVPRTLSAAAAVSRTFALAAAVAAALLRSI